MKQHEFAEAFGVRQATVSDWERGRRRPTLSDEQLATLGRMLVNADMRLIDLFGEEEVEPLTEEKV